MAPSHADRQQRYRDRLRMSRDGETTILLQILAEMRALRDIVTQRHVTSPLVPPNGSSLDSLPFPPLIPPSLKLESHQKETLITNGHAVARPAFANDFDEWWKTYPHKVGKIAALKAFQKARRANVTLECLIEGVGRYIANKPDDRPWCNPATWLNQGRWDDDEQQSHGNGRATVSGPQAPTTPAPTLRDLGLEG